MIGEKQIKDLYERIKNGESSVEELAGFFAISIGDSAIELLEEVSKEIEIGDETPQEIIKERIKLGEIAIRPIRLRFNNYVD